MNNAKKEKKKFKRTLFHKIINFFIGFAALILFILVVFFGFSQTKTFRSFLRDQIVSQVNTSINGTLSIEKIDGSILSSVILHNTILLSPTDTVINAKKIVVKTSPIHLLLKRILVREILIEDTKIFLLQDQDSVWNISKLSKSTDEIEDTSGTFPFSIQVNNLSFQNLSFVRQTYKNLNSLKFYEHVNTNDLRLNDLFLDAKIFANFSSSIIRVYLNNLSVDPNFSSFNLKNFSAEIELTDQFAQIRNLKFVTDSTKLMLSAKLSEVNLFDSVDIDEFKNKPVELSLVANPFYFNDLSTFIETTDFLEGSANFNFNAIGDFGNLNVTRLDMEYLNSIIKLNGRVQNLHTPENLYFDVEVKNSRLVEEEVYNLVKGLDIPKYKNLVLDNFNLSFIGEPLKFNAILDGQINHGSINLITFLDFQKEKIEYDINFTSEKLNLFPIIELNTAISGKGNLKGIGTDPNDMTANFLLNSPSSDFDGIALESLFIECEIDSKVLDLTFNSLINDAKTSIEGILDFGNELSPAYDLTGFSRSLNLQTFTKEIADSSNLNLVFSAKGNNLILDSLIGDFEIQLEPSYLRDLSLDETNIKLSITEENNERKINLISDFVDFSISGFFSLEKAIDLLTYQGITIADLISQKIDELNPIESEDDMPTEPEENILIPAIVKEDLEFNFDFRFKDFKLIALFLKNDELDVSGKGHGTVLNDSMFFRINSEIIIDNLLNKKDSTLFFLANSKANLNFSRDNRVVSFNKIFGNISLESEKIYTGVELNEVIADFVFNQSKLFFNTSVGIGEDLKTDIEGTVSTNLNNKMIVFNNFYVNYKNIPWTSFDTSSVIFTESGIQLSKLILENSSAIIRVDGQVNTDKSHSFFIEMENLPIEIMSAYFTNTYDQQFNGDVNLNFSSTGFLDNPDIIVEMRVNDLNYNDVDFGSLSANVKHNNKISKIEAEFNNIDLKVQYPVLTLDAKLPINFSYLGGEEFIIPDSEIEIFLRASNFNIGVLGNLIPYVKNPSGIITSSIDINGTYEKPITKGFFNAEKGRFTFIENNLDYSFTCDAFFRDQIATIEKIQLSNHAGSKYSGKMFATGYIEMEKLPFSKIDMSINGNLALLGSKSKTRDANIYGDLLIKTYDNWKFTYENDKYYFLGDVIVDKADLVYAAKKQNNTRSNNRIIYKFVEDSSSINLNQEKFIKILNEAERQFTSVSESKTKFDFNTDIIINNIASFNFLIDPDLSQNLNVETTGRLEFETVGNELKTQGALQLLNGSRLEFFKTFDAKGTIRFESDVTDPYLSIVATYIGIIDNFENSGRDEEVAVKLKLNSPLSKLGENLSGENDNLSVYVGKSHIDNDIPDIKYDASNALTFILLNQLSLDINEEQRTSLAGVAENAAYSLLGSQLTSYLNSTLGGLVNNIRVNKYSSNDYKLLFSGKYNNIRYSFGGNTKFLEWNKTDIRFEYLFNPSFLIRVEQKDPVIEKTTGEKIQELGLKYKFEF